MPSSSWWPSTTPISAPSQPPATRPSVPPASLPHQMLFMRASDASRFDRVAAPLQQCVRASTRNAFNLADRRCWQCSSQTNVISPAHPRQPDAERRLMTETVFESKLRGLDLVYRGKVRDVYAVGDGQLLILVSDRLSAFDVVMPDPIPGKGQVLTAISNFWFDRTRHTV